MTSKLRSYCRFHETSPKNQPIGAQPIYDISPNTNTFTIEKTSITLKNYTLESKKSRYKFDKIFDENGENSLFIEIMRPIIRDAYITRIHFYTVIIYNIIIICMYILMSLSLYR